MQVVKVVAAVICDSFEVKKKAFAVQRGHGEFKGLWEFPGGKIEQGEAPQQALIREIQEELNVNIEVGEFICKVEYDYPTFHLLMDCYWSKIKSGQLILREASASKWLTKDNLSSVEWLPADVVLINHLRQEMM